jgi:peptidoglycan/LPS O-acetylase OafA/YrhL
MGAGGGTGPGAATGRDSFGAVRLLAASLVIYGHSYAMLGQEAPRWLGIEVHVFAVRMFFAVSGYLVAGSWLRDPRPLRFAARRALRIMPALLVVVALTVAAVGPALSRLGPAAYLRDPETARYLWNAALAPYFLLPRVFDDGRPFVAVNGSLWSLPVEVAMYALLPLVLAGRRVLLPLALAAGLGAAFWYGQVRPEAVQPVVWWTSVPIALRFASDFAVGAAVRAWRLERLLTPQAGLLAVGAASLLSPYPAAMKAASLLAIPAVTLSLALWPAPGLRAVGRRDDVSYGVYLYGALVQQLWITALGWRVEPLLLTAAALPTALLCGLASWRLVERRALAWKPARTNTDQVR